MGSRGNFDHHGLRWTLGGGGYQFYTTSPTVQWAIWHDPLDFCPGGSLIYAPAPNLKIGATPSDAANVKLIAKPMYTLVEPAPEFDGTPECPSVTMPSSVDDTESGYGLNRLMKENFKIKGLWQINGIGEPLSYISAPEIKSGITTGYEKVQSTLVNAYLQADGVIFGSAAQGISEAFDEVDILYDVAPTKLSGSSFGISQMPDADWPDRSCLRFIGSSEFGGRWFVIMHTANDEWWCWPLLNADQLDPSIAANAPPKLKAQAYKSNVPSLYAKSDFPPYPDWVYAPPERLSEASEPAKPKVRPRHAFTFTSDGTKAIAAMVERTELSDSLFYKTEYMNPGSGQGRSRAEWFGKVGSYEGLIDPASEYQYHAPQEQVTAESATIDGRQRLFGRSDRQPFKYDRLGIVELSFTITITGPKLEDFTFAVDVSDEQSPDALDIYDVGALVQVAFAKPAVSYPTSRQVMAEGIARSAQVLNAPQKDERVTAFITLYQTEEQKKINEGFYQYSEGGISKSVISFYKNRDYESASNPILELPLSQRHGIGYVGKTGDQEILPPEPHPLVEMPYDCTIHTNRPYNDPRNPVFTYSAQILNLDLSTLSFFYFLTINEWSTDNKYVYNEYCKQFTQQTELCNVYVFGTIAHESFVGVQGVHTSYLQGFADAVTDTEFIENNESKIPTTFKNYPQDGTEKRVFDYFEYYNVSGPWWIFGMCGRCIFNTIRDAVSGIFIYDPHSEQPFRLPIRIYEDYFPHARLGRGLTITEEDAKHYLRYAVTEWGEFLAGNKTHPFTIEDGVTAYLPYYVDKDYNFIDHCYGKQNPFFLGRQGFNLEEFVEQGAYYMMELCNLFAEMFDKNVLSWGHLIDNGFGEEAPFATALADSGVTYRFANLCLSRTTQSAFIDPNYFNIESLNPIDNGIRIKNYDWGIHLYNSHKDECIRGTVYDNFFTSIEGHYSFCTKSHYAINKKYATFACGYLIIWDKVYPIFNYYVGNESLYTTQVGNDEGIDGDSFDWKLVDGVGWYCGAIKTSHLDLYNMAFDEGWRTTQRENGRGTPYALPSELPIETKYSASDFRPKFKYLLNSYNEPFYSPDRINGYTYQTLQYEQNRYSFSVSVTIDSNTYSYDDRNERQRLRLSPLFF